MYEGRAGGARPCCSRGFSGSRSSADAVGAVEVGGAEMGSSSSARAVGLPVTMSASQSPRPPRAQSMAVWGE